MLAEIFTPNPPADKYLRASDERGGAAAVVVGMAANQCFKSGHAVKISDLVTGLDRPAMAPMPPRSGPLPMPPKAGSSTA